MWLSKSWLCSQLQSLGHTWASTQLFKSSGHPYGWKLKSHLWESLCNHSPDKSKRGWIYQPGDWFAQINDLVYLKTAAGLMMQLAQSLQLPVQSLQLSLHQDLPATLGLPCGPLCLLGIESEPKQHNPGSRVEVKERVHLRKERSGLLPQSLPVELAVLLSGWLQRATACRGYILRDSSHLPVLIVTIHQVSEGVISCPK